VPPRLAAPCPSVPADTAAATGATLPAVLGAGLPVPVVDGTTVPHANLDLAASAPALQYVADRVAALLPYHASVHRGAGYASQVCTAALEAARRTVGRFVGARADDVVVFTRNTTDALNLLAGAVPGSVLCLDVEHHANLLAWRGGSHRILRAAATVDATLTDLRDALADTPTALVAVTGASNVTGEVLPLAEIARIAHEAGARIVVDAAQLAPHRRVDIESAGIDYVALSGHKLYAPFGSGALVGRRDWLDVATPYLAGGGAVQRVTAAGTGTAAEVSWAPAPHRHEAGTPNVPGAVALLTGWAEGAVRAGLGLGTTASDVDRLVAALHELVENGPRWTYECVDGRWVPVDDPRDLDPLGLGGTTAGTGHGGCGH